MSQFSIVFLKKKSLFIKFNICISRNLWEKAKELQTRAEEASSKVPSSNNNDGSSGNTDDEFDEDDLLDWRSKGVRRR